MLANYTRSRRFKIQGVDRMDKGFIAGLGSAEVEAAKRRDGEEIRLLTFLSDCAKLLLALMFCFCKKLRDDCDQEM